MIYLIDYVLPDSFFANNLRALSVDMAVFRELLRIRLPDLSKHLDDLQKRANSNPQGNKHFNGSLLGAECVVCGTL